MSLDYKNFLDQPTEENKDVLASTTPLESVTATGFKTLIEATKKSNNLPFGKTRDMYESFPSFHNVVQMQANFVMSTLTEMLKYTSCKGNMQNKDDEDKLEMIVEANDVLLENVGITLDELSGIKKNPKAEFLVRNSISANGAWNKNRTNYNIKQLTNAAAQVLNKILHQTKNIEKPQLKFKDKVNNDPNIPFEPRIKYKYNMLKPLSCILEMSEDGHGQFTHPYEFELNKFYPSEEQLVYEPAIPFKPLVETPLILITKPEDVTCMLNDLEKYREIAVDLEHHSYRSFQGFTCLMQISTRDSDYIIDTLELRSELELLNKIFTNPSVVKVFHGADSDILWLQKDLSLYVVNMFDTHQAAKLLNFPKLSLSFLLSHYCNIEAQKHFQLADWRIRPLPEELLTYAREDTHYLLFIYDNLKKALIEKANNKTNLLKSVINESTRICLQRYLKPSYNNDGYLDIYHRSKKLFDNRQKCALQRLFEWRDKIARELDESYAYVLPDHMMLNISEVLPREAQGILACCNPVPVPVRQNLISLNQIILMVREQPLVKPILEEQRFHRYTSSITAFDNPLQCPHDLNFEGEFRDDLHVLCSSRDDANLGDNNSLHETFCCSEPIVDVFEISNPTKNSKLLSISRRAVHLTPFHRYQLSKKFSDSIEIKHLNNNEKVNFDKTQKNIPQIKKESKVDLVNDHYNKNKESVPNKKSDGDESQILSAAEEPVTGSNKRKIQEENSKHPKKAKEEIIEEVTSVKESKGKCNTEMLKKGKQKKKPLRTNKKQFQPFDYQSVDFEKFQTSTLSSTKKVKKNYKPRKKSGKKSIKISV